MVVNLIMSRGSGSRVRASGFRVWGVSGLVGVRRCGFRVWGIKPVGLEESLRLGCPVVPLFPFWGV